MKQCITLAAKIPIMLLLFAAIFTSCVPQKKIKYLQREQESDTTTFNPVKLDVNYLIQTRDNLYIKVYSLDPNASMFFNKQGTGGGNYNDYANDASIYLNSYSVDDEGNIEFPIIGKISVKGKTVKEIQTYLQGVVSEYLKEVAVVVKLVNFKVTLVGEVMRPGEFTFYQNQVNIFEAIAMAGDMGEFANRSNIALIRKTKDGSMVHYLDLNKINILHSEFYYLQPNDILYIAPLGYKRWGLGSVFPWALVLASISTTLLLINYFK